MSWLDNITKTINLICVTIVALLPIILPAWNKIKKKKSEVDDKIKSEDTEKRIISYDRWEHDESTRVISRVKNECNAFKDKSGADLVSYFQIENGTTAISKLQNMFLTCLAEDDRYGNVPKAMMKQQRIPYSQVASWIDLVRDHVVGVADKTQIKSDTIRDMVVEKKVGSSLSEQVLDAQGYFFGIVLFEYAKENYNKSHIDGEKQSLHDFRTSIESIFRNYHLQREEKLKEFNLTLTDISQRRK